MANYYLDIETTGLNPETSSILTIQFQKLDFNTGNPIGELIILKSWESSEKEILFNFYNMFFDTSNIWDFIAHGYNLKFEHDFLLTRGKIHGININLLKRPCVDLHPIGILMNNGNFKGSGLDKISGKVGDGMQIIEMYASCDYVGIEEYIQQETKEYIKLYVWLKKRMPELLKEFKNGK